MDQSDTGSADDPDLYFVPEEGEELQALKGEEARGIEGMQPRPPTPEDRAKSMRERRKNKEVRRLVASSPRTPS
eukprot:8782283-Pyramimonas_sp.AAC.1